ncbi:MAG: hypothetical protein ACI9O6_000408 [Glaciecola sp.]|jgi:hypothetical protein
MITPVFNAVSLVFALQGATSLHPELANQNIVNQAKKCADIANDKARLSCFDAIFKLEAKDPQKRPMPFEKNPTPPQAPPLSPQPLSPQPSPPKPLPPVATQIVESTSAEARSEPVETKVAPKEAVQKFGAEHLKTEKDTDIELEVVTFTIEKVSLTLRKQQRFYFTNGQVWENKTSKQLRVSEGDEVEIKDGAFSAFYLSKVEGTGSVRVKRVK